MKLLEVESRAKFPVGAALLALIAIGLGITTFLTEEIGYAVAGIPFWTTAFCLVIWRTRAFYAEFSDDGIALRDSEQVISYESISYVDFAAKCDENGDYRSKPAPITVVHDGGELTIPANIDQPSIGVFEFLSERFVPRADFPLDPALEDFRNEQQEVFGPEKVFAFCARRQAKRSRKGKRTTAIVAAGLALGALGWGAAAELLMEDGWFGGAITLGICAILAFLISRISRRSAAAGVRNWDLAGVVVSPVGVAMIQGHLKGQMKWDEINGVKLGNAAKNFEYRSSRSTPGIVLKFDGGALTIVDIYNQPLPYVFSVVQNYWQGGDDA